jgi:hypothetical protein
MLAYQKERIDNVMLFFASEHYNKTKKYLSQTALYKYLAFFEFRMLEKYGDMPLGLHYKAMEHGPVPDEIYSNRDNAAMFRSIIFEQTQTAAGNPTYIIKFSGKFDSDYFSEDELSEMKSLIEIFAVQWVGAGVMSDASHQAIRAWNKTYKAKPNALIDPITNFTRDITKLSLGEMTLSEERYLTYRTMEEFAR